jgi:hypothetical protein
MMFGRPKPEEVFTPRAATVNAGMYIHRPDLEKSLTTALRGNLHLVLHGESGTGKSWLYKKVFQDLKASFIVANLANASRLGSITAEIKNLIDREGNAEKTGYEEEKTASVDAVVASAELKHTAAYDLGQKEPFERCLEMLRHKAGSSYAILVFDNLESAFGNEVMLKELADIIILCDDERYAKYKVKILIVGVPSGVKEYYYKTPNHASVSNRLYELPEVARMSEVECADLVRKGFVEKLRYQMYDIDAFAKRVSWITDRIPLMIHEYCLEAAYIAEETNALLVDAVPRVDEAWLAKNHYHAYSVVEHHMNERDTKVGRRNQTLYALSFCEGEQLKYNEVEALLRREFPESTRDVVLNVPQMLSALEGTERAIVRRSPKGDAYTFCDPRYRMVLRAMLSKGEGGKVERKPITRRQ